MKLTASRDRYVFHGWIANARISSGAQGLAGFTLIELLVSIAVLIILGLLIGQILSAAVRIMTLSNRATDASSQAQLALERIGIDLAAMIRRQDLDVVMRNPSVTEGDAEVRNALFILSGVGSVGLASGNNRNISLVAYQVGPHVDNGNRLALLRAGIALPWNRPGTWGPASYFGIKGDGDPVRLSSSDSQFPASLIPTVGDFDVMVPGVIRMVVGFQLYPDNESVDLLDGSHLANAQGQIVYSPPIRGETYMADLVDLDRIASVIVGLVVVDAQSLDLLDAVDVIALAEHFDLPAINQLPIAAWQDSIKTASSTGVPLSAAQAVRVYQRVYSITPYRGSQP